MLCPVLHGALQPMVKPDSAPQPRVASQAKSNDVSNGLFAGRFTEDRPLGAGGMGVIHRAYDHQLQRFVALKRPKIELDGPSATMSLVDAKFLRRFELECHFAKRLSHPGHPA